MPRLSSGLRSAMCDSLKQLYTNGVLHLYSTTQPASADDEESGVLLAIISLNGGAFVPGSPANGLNFDLISHDALFTNTTLKKSDNEVWSGIGLANGTIGYGRFYDNNRIIGDSPLSIRFDGSASVSGGDFTVSTATTKVGSPITVDNMDIIFPNR